ncbi:hypothetical protein L249_0069 [Ophiocordyceps polyrhachis-furcata BCC 54312]|uniref:Uncharacterized protein n=1 Tax=Ophiocordyceps polyrhachis-furcata BCC 54312 TaxID=1330021 RepID=A0A367LD22_9HYPO|nr:hypothetical protein L249_0069 [Ophiocordyceps polyrhachis-furcata BCC 54312]
MPAASSSVHVGVGTDTGTESELVVSHAARQKTSADRRSPICRDDIQRWIDGAGPSFVYLSLLDRNSFKTQSADGRGQTSLQKRSGLRMHRAAVMKRRSCLGVDDYVGARVLGFHQGRLATSAGDIGFGSRLPRNVARGWATSRLARRPRDG